MGFLDQIFGKKEEQDQKKAFGKNWNPKRI